MTTTTTATTDDDDYGDEDDKVMRLPDRALHRYNTNWREREMTL